jgi:hypothetical protein
MQIFSGEGGIRTLGAVSRTTVFETATIDRSATSPDEIFMYKGCDGSGTRAPSAGANGGWEHGFGEPGAPGTAGYGRAAGRKNRRFGGINEEVTRGKKWGNKWGFIRDCGKRDSFAP